MVAIDFQVEEAVMSVNESNTTCDGSGQTLLTLRLTDRERRLNRPTGDDPKSLLSDGPAEEVVAAFPRIGWG